MLIKEFEEQVKKNPGKIAVKMGRLSLSYDQLNRDANRVAMLLTKRWPRQGKHDAVGLFLDHGHHMIAAIFGTLKVGKIYVPLSTDYPENRLSYILSNSESTVIVTSSEHEERAKDLAEKAGIDVLVIDNQAEAVPIQNREREILSDELAYIMYTSGSTGRPKGVKQTHRNVLYFIKHWTRIFSISPADNMTLLSSFCHDASIPDIFGALLNGAVLFPLDMKNRENSAELSDFLIKEKITVYHSVPSLYSYFAGTLVGSEVFAQLRFIILGGEAVRKHEVDMLKTFFPHSILANVYGQTESTVNSVQLIGRDDTFEEPLIGEPLDETAILVVDEEGDEVDTLQTGEIVIACPYVSPGYWKNEEASQDAFSEDEELGRLYWTGDYGRLMPGGGIVFMGRKDHQVKIRGFRIELGEIESCLLSHEDIKESVVKLTGDGREDRLLAAYYAADKGVPGALLREFSARELPDYMVPTFYVQLRSFPLTQSGKIDRKALPDPEIGPDEEYTAPRNNIEKELAAIWSAVLGVEEEKIGINTNFFALGGHSLRATTVVSIIHKRMDVRLPLAKLFRKPTIKEIAGLISESEKERHVSIRKAADKTYYSLSSAQKRLFILEQMGSLGTTYNMPRKVKIKGPLDSDALKRTLDSLIERHESLRTSFSWEEGHPVQCIHDPREIEFEIEYYESGNGQQAIDNREKQETRPVGDAYMRPNPGVGAGRAVPEINDSFVRSFDLSSAPLLRVGLIRVEQEEHILSFDVHHIIADGISLDILVYEFMRLYNGEELPPLGFQYKDFSEWWNSKEQQETIKQQELYWLEQFADDIPVLDLPYDFPRPPVQSFVGSSVNFKLGAQETAALNRVAFEQEVTLFMVLIAVFNVLLSRLSGQEDIVVGTPTAGRRHADVAGIIGIFINTLGLRSYPIGEKSFRDYLQEVKQSTLTAFENQEYQFEDLVEKIDVNRDVSRNPLFDVLLVLQNMGNQKIEIPSALKMESYDYETGIAKFDLSLYAMEFGEKLGFGLEYCTRLFKEETIVKFIRYFKILITEVTAGPRKKIEEFRMVPEEEMRQVLFAFNNTGISYDKNKTLVRLFEEQAEKKPDRVVVIGAGHHPAGLDGNSSPARPQQMTYRMLEEKAGIIGEYLREKGVSADIITGLLVERSLSLVTGLLGILKAGGAYLPIDPEYPQERIDYMLRESCASLLLTTLKLAEDVEKPVRSDVETVFIEEIGSREEKTGNRQEAPRAGGLAYVIYTSGSTGKPKGVALSHRNVVNFIKGMTEVIDFSPHKTILAVTTICFDIFVLEVLLPLVSGLKFIIADETGQKDPGRLARLIVKNRIDMLQFTPSRLNLLHSFDEELECLSEVCDLMVGGEAFPERLFSLLKEKYTGNIYNMYGPTETTVWSAVKDLTEVEKIDIGSPIANTQIYIVDKAGSPLPAGIPGELYIGGDGLARGYINRPELTAERFKCRFSQRYRSYKTHSSHSTNGNTGVGAGLATAHDSSAIAGQPQGLPLQLTNFQLIYQTGDLARWLPDGNIEYLGRIDNQVKVRGFRIELGEIENRLAEHALVKQAVVIGKPAADGDLYLIAYVTAEGVIESELRDFIAGTLPDYMVPARFVFLEKIPLTPNGKVDRKALPEPGGGTGEQGYTAPRDAVELKLVEIWSGVLGIDRQAIGIDNNFFHLGGHSLKATQMTVDIQKVLNVNVPLEQVFRTPAVRGLAEFVKGASHFTFYSINRVEKKEYYALSSAQRRLYVLQRLDHGSSTYNIPSIMTLTGEIDPQRFRGTFGKLIDRHESLRTSFRMVGDEPVQRVYDPRDIEFDIEYYESGNREKQEIRPVEQPHPSSVINHDFINSFVRPFDLSSAPLLRVELMETGADAYILAVDMHHIISDGVSGRIFVEDFMALYRGENLSPLRIQYKDFSEWRNSEEQQETIKQQEFYWLEQFTGEVPVLNLPGDFPRPPVQSFAGSTVSFELGPEETAALNRVALEQEVTLFMVLIAVFNVLLSRLGGQEDIVIGTPTAGRRHADVAGIIGIFVNTLGIRIFPVGEKTFGDFLQEVKQTTLNAFENQEYQFEELVEEVEVNRDVSRNPLFDVMFTLQNMENPEIEIPSGLKLGGYTYERGAAKFDLSLYGVEIGERLSFSLEYCIKLFKDETIIKFANYFKTLIREVTRDLHKKISETQMVPEEEMRQVLFEFNDTGAPYETDKTIVGLFEEQAERTPTRVAVVGAQHPLTGQDGEMPSMQPVHLTYRQFQCEVADLAGVLIRKGVGPDTAAALIVDRSLEMMLGIFAILKAGGAYLPIDPYYPQNRQEYIIMDSSADLLLTSRAFEKQVEKLKVNTLRENQIETIFIENNRSGLIHQTPGLLSAPRGWGSAYIIYTSGSTGKPKGVMVRHGSVVNVITALQRLYPLKEGDAYLLKTAYVFDVSVAELFGWFPGGGRLAVLEPGGEKEPEKIIRAVENFEVTHINFVPSMFNLFVDELDARNIVKLATLKYIFLAGEALNPGLVNKFRQFGARIKLENIYGPTEGTVYATYYSLSKYKNSGSIPIGRPVANTGLLVLNREDQPQPIGVPGELCIAGAGIAAGYLNNPELTNEKFPTAWGSVEGPSGHLGAAHHLNNLPKQKFCSNFFKSLAPGRGHHVAGDKAEGVKLYKTGDLARWLPDGNVEFLGRMDHQVKIRGFRIELGEIEERLLAHEKVKEAVVIDREREAGEKYLCTYIVRKSAGPDEEFPEAEEQRAEINAGAQHALDLKQYLSHTLPGYMIPSYFVFIERIPLNPSGKVDRKKLPGPGLSTAQKEYAAPRNEFDRKLITIWTDILRVGDRGTIPEGIGIDDNFFEMGGHSLKAVRMMARLHKELQVKIEMAKLFNFPTIRGIADYIHRLEKEQFTSIAAVEQRTHYPLSSAQKRLYILHGSDPTKIGYNMPVLLHLEGEPEMEKLAGSFKELVVRHESLRTSFHRIDEELAQRVIDPEDIEFEIEYYKAGNRQEARDSRETQETTAEIIDSFIRPFDLTYAPLFRVGLIRIDRESHILVMDMHHIIADGTSFPVLTGDLMSIYAGRCIPSVQVHYKDYCRWRSLEKQEESLKHQEIFWLEKFAGEIPALNLPTDYPRPAVQSFAGRTVFFEIFPEETASLNRFALKQGATLYMVLLSIYNILLGKLSGQEDIIVGAPTAGRRHDDTQGIIGVFINTLCIRNFPAGGKTFRDFLQEVKITALESMENQDYQFEDLVEQVKVNRDISRNPLFDVMFVLQNIEFDEVEIPGLKLSSYKHENRTAKFDMTMQVFEVGSHLSCSLEYCTAIFKEETILRFCKYFKNIIVSVIRDFEGKIAAIDMLSESERQQLLYDFNDTGESHPKDKTIPEFFEAQVIRTPDQPAVVGYRASQGESVSLTYSRLNEESGQLAQHLIRQGVKANDLIAILVDRSVEMLIGILSIFKTGCGYVPLNPSAPVERTGYILSECAVRHLLTTRTFSEVVSKFQNLKIETILIENTGNKQEAIGNRSYGAQPSEEQVSRPVGDAYMRPETRVGAGLAPAPGSSCDGGLLQGLSLHASTRNSAAGLAYVIFTSGSTGKPKGVPITHANLSPLLHWGYSELGIGAGDRTIQNLSYYFDWSVWEIFITLTTGACLYPVSSDILLNPKACIDFIIEKEITVLHITPSQYRYLVDQGRKLHTLKYLFIGAEKLDYDLTGRSLDSVNESCRVFNMYGPTEATIIAAVLEIDRDEYGDFKRLSSVPIGGPVGNTALYILDKHDMAVPVNVTGELVIAGDGLAAGYLNNPELTGEKFPTAWGGVEGPAGHLDRTRSHMYSKPDVGARRAVPGEIPSPGFSGAAPRMAGGRGGFYKTGDLARWLPAGPPAGGAPEATFGGKIEFIGRVDYQVKVRGFRIEPGEIENRLIEHEAIKEAVVIDKEKDGGEKYLCAYIVARSAAPVGGDLRQFLSQSLPDYMIPSYFVEIDSIPLTANGKLDRRALPEPEGGAGAEFIAPRDKVEHELASLWAGVLDTDRDAVGIDDNFFESGGHSINATLLMSRIKKQFNVDIPLTEIFKSPTVRGIARYINDAEKKHYDFIPAVEMRDYYPVSSAQKRMFILNRLKGDNTSDNTPDVYVVEGKLEKERFEDVAGRLLARHETLRTSFELLDDEVIQRVYRRIALKIGTVDLESEDQTGTRIEEEIGHFIRPFNLSEAPLFRVGLLRLSAEKHMLMVDIHHIIRDGTASLVFIREFVNHYHDIPLPALRVQYKDFSPWQNRLLNSDFIKKQEVYWLNVFSGDIPVLNMPVDFPRPTVQSFDGDCVEFELDRDLSLHVDRLARRHKATLYMVLLSVYTILLAKYSGQEDIVVGAPIAGRPHYDLENLVGMFVNTLAMRNYPQGDVTFARFLEQVKHNALKAYENQDYQFEELVNTLKIQPDPGRQSLFDTMFAVQNVNVPRFTTNDRGVSDLEITPYKFEDKVTQFDIMFHAFQIDDRVAFKLLYCTRLFKAETIRMLIDNFTEIIGIVVENSDIKLKDIKISHGLFDEEIAVPQTDFDF